MTRVLVVDDYPAIADLIRVHIQKTYAADVDTCHSAAEALALIKEHPYDVIISDYDMRGMDGIALLRHLRESGDQTPFILMTGLDHGVIARQAEELGAIYLLKGDHPTRQFSTILQLVRHMAHGDPIAAPAP